MTPISEVLESYKTYIEVKYPAHFKKYGKRLKNNEEGGRAEALLFSILRGTFKHVKISEDLSSGGTDFLCVDNDQEFTIEVTSLDSNAVTKQSGWKNEIDKTSLIWFSMITHILRTKVSTKVPQLAGQTVPRVLAITSEHIGANFLLGPHGAEFLLTSDTKISVPIGKPIEKPDSVTDLKESVFFRWKNGEIELCRRSISAVLLISILSEKCYIVGILHPQPLYFFPIKLFPSVPFIRIKKWPPENNKIETEWVIHSPSKAEFYYRPIILRNDELRTI